MIIIKNLKKNVAVAMENECVRNVLIKRDCFMKKIDEIKLKFERFLDRNYIGNLLYNEPRLINKQKITEYDVNQCPLCEPKDRDLKKEGLVR